MTDDIKATEDITAITDLMQSSAWGVSNDTPESWPLPEDAGTDEHRMAAPAWAFEDRRVSGARLLDEIAALVSRYVVLPSTAALHAVALWIVHTHAIAAAESTPRLHVKSAEKRSGKSRLLELLELLTSRPLLTANISAAALFRQVEAEHPTLLVDEVDTIFGRSRGGDERNEELRGLLNAGHRRGAKALRCAGVKMQEVKAYDPFCAVALAGIGDLPSTIEDRSITIAMKRRAPTETVQRFRRRDVAGRAGALADAATDWAIANLDALTSARPDLPDSLDDRAADGWEPLLAIADAAGGEWPERARAAAVALAAGRGAEEDTLGVRLLAECRLVFTADRLPSADLAERLAKLEDAPWGAMYGAPLDARGLAKLLRRYGIKPRQIRFGDKNIRGYERSDFEDAWSRYCPSGPDASATPLQPLHSRSEAISVPLQATLANGHHTPSDLRCSDVALKTTHTGAAEGTGPCTKCTKRTGKSLDGRWLCSRHGGL